MHVATEREARFAACTNSIGRTLLFSTPCDLAWDLLNPRVMRIGIPQWQGLVSPVFDVAGNLLLVDVKDGRETKHEVACLAQSDTFSRASEISRLGVDTLICGAISAPLEARLAAAGVRVVGFVRGPVEEVLAGFLKDELASPGFLMPGCYSRRRMRRGGNMMRGRLGRRSGRPGTDGLPGYGSDEMAGECLCPECGETVAHTPGKPCRPRVCPKYGARMTRVSARESEELKT